MALSAFDLYSVGIGPSSSHTVGPMRAAKRFVDGLVDTGRLPEVARVQAELFGSLGATGHGHGSAKAVVLGLEGEEPATVDTESSDERVTAVREQRSLLLAGTKPIAFDGDADLVLHRRRSLPAHPNGMVFRALDDGGGLLAERTYYSVGGGFVVDEAASGADRIVLDDTPLPLPFTTGAQLLEHCAREGMSISDVMLANEQAWRSEAEIRAGMLHLWAVMQACVEQGCRREGVLPGGLKVPRRAPRLFRELTQDAGSTDPLQIMDWVNLFALAVNEENASGGRIVTAPTNGAAGIIPAVLHY
jgi:L-serine dehydratase